MLGLRTSVWHPAAVGLSQMLLAGCRLPMRWSCMHSSADQLIKHRAGMPVHSLLILRQRLCTGDDVMNGAHSVIVLPGSTHAAGLRCAARCQAWRRSCLSTPMETRRGSCVDLCRRTAMQLASMARATAG